MRTFLKKSVFVAGLIVLSSPFISCDNKEVKKEKEPVVIADNIPISTKEKVTARKPIVFIAGFDKGHL